MKNILMMCVLMGCASKEGGDTAGDAGDPTAGVTGKYQNILAAATGCVAGDVEGGEGESEDFWVVDWATGLLQIDGTKDSLTYLFPLGGEEGYEFSGTINDSLAFTMGGEIVFEDTLPERDGLADVDVMARLTMSGVGTGTKQDTGCWRLEGKFTIDVNENDDEIDGNNCKLEVPFVASQLQGDSCSSI